MSRPVISALRAPVAALLLIGSAAVASPAFADNDFVVLSGGSVTEGDSGSTSLVFTASVASLVSAPVTMRFQAMANHTTPVAGDATAGSACGGTVDFVAVDGTITIPANANQTTVSVPICGDTAIEGTETFTALVQNVQGAGAYCLELCATHGTILDNDTAQPIAVAAPPSVSVSNASALEGDSLFGGVVVNRLSFAVSLSAASDQSVSVQYQTALNKALPATMATGGSSCFYSGTDFINAAGTLQFNPGETRKTVWVSVCADNVNEANETMLLRLLNPVGATIGDGTGVGTIIDDD